MARNSVSGYGGNTGKKKQNMRAKLRSFFVGGNGKACNKKNSQDPEKNVTINDDIGHDGKILSHSNSNDHTGMATSTSSCPPDVGDGFANKNGNTQTHINKVMASIAPNATTISSTTPNILNDSLRKNDSGKTIVQANHKPKAEESSTNDQQVPGSSPATVRESLALNKTILAASNSKKTTTSTDGHKKHRLKRATLAQRYASIEIQNGYEKVPLLDYIKLPRGGISLDTEAIGRIQYGIPPETIKDSMCLGLDVPIYYIVPVERFCREVGTSLGVNLAEFEFPAYFNFFVKKLRCTLIVDSDGAESNIKRVFGETLLGPLQFRRNGDPIDYEEEDFAPDYPQDNIPSFLNELKHFRVMPDGSELVLETLLDFRHFEKLDTKEKGAYLYEAIGVPESMKLEENLGNTLIPINQEGKKEVSDDDSDVEDDDDDDDVMKNWSFLDVVAIAEMAIIWPPKATPEEIAARSVPRVEVFKMPGGSEYIIHDIDSNNKIIGRARIAGNVRVSDSMSVEGFKYMKKVPQSKILTTHKEESSYGEDPNDSMNLHGSLLDDGNALPPTFHPPSFGVTVLGNSHGFDKSGSTSGYVLWINGRGVMIDPPPYSSATLEREGIRSRTIVGIILTHCHADHDAGAFQKVLTGSPVVVITTPTIYKSFIRKYAALSNLSPALLRHSHRYKPAIIGQPLRFQGATLHFTYTLHSIPCVGFRVDWRGRSMVFTGDHYNNPEGIDKLIDSGVMTKGRGEDLKALPLQDCDLLLHEAGAPPIHTPLSVLMKLPQKIKDRLYIVHTSALPADCDLRVAPTGTAGTIRLDDHLIPSPNAYDQDLALRVSTFSRHSSRNSITSSSNPSFVYSDFRKMHDYDMLSTSIGEQDHASVVPRSLPLVSLRPTSSTDAWFILNLLSAVPFLTSLSYVTTMEVLETARVDTFCMNDIVVPSHRRRDVLCVVWEGTCMERVRTSKQETKTTEREGTTPKTRRTSTFSLNHGSYQPLTKSEIRNIKNRPVAVWHAGDWTGPRSVQPDKNLSGESANSETYDIVAMSSQGIKAINIEFSNLHSILKSGSELYRKYLARKHKTNDNIQRASDNHIMETTAASKTMFESAIKNLSIIELLETNSALRKLSAVQKRHFECLAEGPIYFTQGQRLWRSGTVVEKAYLIVAGTSIFLAGRRNARTIGKSRATSDPRLLSDTEKVKNEFSDDSSLSDENDGSFSSSSARSFDLDNSISTCGESADLENLKVLIKGLKKHADDVNNQPVRRRSESSDSLPENNFDSGKAYNDRVANKVLGRLYNRKKITANLVFSRGHFLGDVSKMVAGLLSVGRKSDDLSGDDESFAYGYGDKPMGGDSHTTVATIHEREGDEHIVHNSTLVAGKDGCVVLVFPKSKICPFLDEYPGLLLSLLGTQVVV